jgi:trans-aconitate methyltransferase
MASPAQHWDPSTYAQHAHFVPRLGEDVANWITKAPPARVLDLGCGDGVLSQVLVARGFEVLGVDASTAMVTRAQERGIDAAQMEGEALSFSGEFDVVFSNATLHWLKRADVAAQGVYRALRTGGCFVGEFGGAGNTARVVDALCRALKARGVDPEAHHPWYFPSVAQYADVLERAGFRVDTITTFARPTPLPSDVTDWITTFGQSFLSALPEHARGAFLAEVRAALVPQLYRDGTWVLDYVRLRFVATRV